MLSPASGAVSNLSSSLFVAVVEIVPDRLGVSLTSPLFLMGLEARDVLGVGGSMTVYHRIVVECCERGSKQR